MANMTPKAKRNRKKRLLEGDGPVCQICGRQFAPDELTFDHIQAKATGGSNAIENLRLACRTCNFSRHH